MSSAQAKVGKATATNLSAVIERYQQEKILINADIQATGDELKEYFLDSQMASIGHTLEEPEITIGGEFFKSCVSGAVNLLLNALIFPVKST